MVYKHDVIYLVKNILSDVSGTDIRLRINAPQLLMTVGSVFRVPVPKVEIVDERGDAIPDKFYKAGSTIELKCVISQVPQPSSYVTWKHGQRMLNYDTSRGGIR